MNRKIFRKSMGELSLVFNNEVDEYKSELYWENLRDLKNDDFAKAVKFLIQNNKFFPTIAEIRQVATGSQAESIDAWQELIDAFREVGWYGSPHFGNPIIYECVRTFGGWKHLCDVPLDRFLQKDFERVYNILRRREEVDKILELSTKEKKEIIAEKGEK